MMRRFLTRLFWFVVAFAIATRLVVWWTEAWWYHEVGYHPVYLKIMGTRLAAFALGSCIAGSLLWLNVLWTRRGVERFPGGIRQRNDRKIRHEDLRESNVRESNLRGRLEESGDDPDLSRYRHWVFGGMVVALSLLAGAWASSQWMLWHSFLGAVAVNVRDPVFNLDAGFYLFHLPALRFGWNFIFITTWVTLIVVIFLYGWSEALQVNEGHTHLSPPALRHLSAIGAALLVWIALGYRLSAYGLLTAHNGFVFGAGYTDIYWRLPLMAGISAVALVAAALLWRWGQRGDLKRAAWVVPGYFMASLLAGTIVPALVQRLKVDPDEERLEAPYITRHIVWTRRAYGLDHVREIGSQEEIERRGNKGNRSGQKYSLAPINAPAEATQGLPVWPRLALLTTFNHRQAFAQYQFADADIDRYRIGNEMRPVMVAARELPPENIGDPSWINRRLRWTHGYGLVMCDANRSDAQGQPLFYLSELASRPSNGARLRVQRPQIFFGELRPFPVEELAAAGRLRAPAAPVAPVAAVRQPISPVSDYVVLNPQPGGAGGAGGAVNARRAPDASAPDAPVLDVPVLDARTGYYKYTGNGGVEVGATWRKWLMAWRFGDLQLALTPLVGSRSRIVWHRRVIERCRHVAPFLTFIDTDPYPVLTDDGRIVWMLDLYSTSDSYPYSQPVNGRSGINYVRNAVKATVDAYNGSVQFYIVDATDPLIQVYSRIFPGLFHPLSDMPEDLRRHARYPAAQLAIQAEIWARFHVDTTSALRSGSNAWMRAPGTLSDMWVRVQDLGSSVIQRVGYAVLPVLSPLPLPPDAARDSVSGSPEFNSWSDAAAGPPRSHSMYATIVFSPQSRGTRGNAVTATQATVTASLLADGDYSGGRAQVTPQRRLLQWRPRATSATPAPVQVQAQILTSTTLQEYYRLWKQQDWSALVSAPAVAPVGDSLLYAQGILAQPGGESVARPSRLQKVAIVSGGQPFVGNSMADALRLLTGRNTPKSDEAQGRGTPSDDKSRSETAAPRRERAEVLLQQAREQLAAMRRARRNNDWAAYGQAERKLGALLDRQP